MLQSVKKLIWALLVVAGAEQAVAFSLIGTFEAWQTPDVGYNFPVPPTPYTAGEAGGPKNLGEEYRWNTPTIVFGFDPTFLEFFGQKGVEAVEAAFTILNDLPAASEMSADLHEFPLDTRRFNYQASALQIR